MTWTKTGNIKGPAGDSGNNGIILSNAYTGNTAASSADVGNIASMSGGAGNNTFSVDPSAFTVGSSGIVSQDGATQAQITASTGTLVLGGATAKTYKQGSWLTWRVKSSTVVEVHGECAAS